MTSMPSPQTKHSWQETLIDQMKQTNFWNLLAKDLDRIDLSILDVDGKDFSKKLIDQLLTLPTFDQTITPSAKSTKTLQHFFVAAKNNQYLSGGKSIGCGFPIFIAKDPDNPFRPIAAPLFIWRMELKAHPNRNDIWQLQFAADTPPEPNYLLLSHLERNHDLQLIDKYRSILNNGTLDRSQLSQLCYDLIVQLQLEDQRSTSKIYSSPTVDIANQIAEKGAIHWSGKLALFPPQPFDDTEQLSVSGTELKIGNSPSYSHPFGLLLADPFQKEVVENSASTSLGIVEGFPGSGKTHTLTNIITNALSNKQKCLVVSSNIPAQIDIENLLADCNLKHLSFRIQDTEGVQKLLNVLPSHANPSGASVLNEENFNLYLNKCKREHDRLNTGFRAIKGNNFGNYTWTETVGQFLQANRKEGKELLNSQLNPNEFVFAFGEYEILKKAVITSEPLYRKLNTLRHPLKNLNQQIFDKETVDESKDFVEEQLQIFLQKSSRLHHRYIIKTDEYGGKLNEHYENYFQNSSKQLHELEEMISDGLSQFGKEFEDSGIVQSSKLRVYKVFSSKHKNIFSAHEKIISKYQQLKRTCEQRNYFDYAFPDISEAKNIQKLQLVLKDFSKNLKHWQQQIPTNLQEEITRLSNKTIHPDLDYKEQIVELEYALDLLVEELNETRLYQEALENKMLTIPMRQQYLENIIEQLETTAYNMRDFEVFYDWHKHWLESSGGAQKLVQALVKVKPRDWMAAFESWYFHHRLTYDHQITIPQNDDFLNSFVGAYRQLKKTMPQQINTYWQSQRVDSLRQLKRTKRESYQYLFTTKNNTDSRKKDFRFLWHVAADVISDIFPVLIVTPEMAIKLFSKKPHFFDQVLIDQTQLLSAGLAAPILRLGKRQIAFTDSKENHFKEEQSFIDYLKQEGAREWNLPYQHRTIASDIARFNQHFFEQKNIQHHKIRTVENPFKVLKTDGIYDEDQSINVKEARIVLQTLQKCKSNSTGKYPIVGVACSTIEQRDYIANQLLQLKQKKGTGFEKIIALEDAGLLVFQLEEMSGFHPEILIFSLTFGYNNVGNRLTADLDYLKDSDGELGHYLAASRPSQQLVIIHSLPMEILNYFLLRTEEKNLSSLAKHINFAAAVENKDKLQQRQTLASFANKELESSSEKNHAVFMQELANALIPYLGESRIQLNKVMKNISLPLTIKPIHDRQPPLVIQADGFFSDAQSGAYLWEQHLRDEITSLGLECYPIWSVNWWKNPKQEARKLASVVIKKDGEYKM